MANPGFDILPRSWTESEAFETPPRLRSTIPAVVDDVSQSAREMEFGSWPRRQSSRSLHPTDWQCHWSAPLAVVRQLAVGAIKRLSVLSVQPAHLWRMCLGQDVAYLHRVLHQASQERPLLAQTDRGHHGPDGRVARWAGHRERQQLVHALHRWLERTNGGQAGVTPRQLAGLPLAALPLKSKQACPSHGRQVHRRTPVGAIQWRQARKPIVQLLRRRV